MITLHHSSSQKQKHRPQSITFETKFQVVRENGAHCNLVLIPADSTAPSLDSLVEIKFGANNNVEVEGTSTIASPGHVSSPHGLSSISTYTWITVQINFDWDACQLNIVQPTVLTASMTSTGGVCNYDGVDAINLRGWLDPSSHSVSFLQAWRKIDLVGSTGTVENLHELIPAVPMPYPGWYDDADIFQAPNGYGSMQYNGPGNAFEGIALKLDAYYSYYSSGPTLDMAIMVPENNNPGVGGGAYVCRFACLLLSPSSSCSSLLFLV